MAASPAQALFKVLPGVWRLRREIDDTRLGAGSFDGGATFTPRVDGALLYQEHGELQLGAWRGPAWRQWVYALEGEALAVRYPGTGAELHLFQFDESLAHHEHICGADRYDAVFRRMPDGALSLSYAVSGPAKNYRLRTLLTRA